MAVVREVEALRFGVEEPPVWLVWAGRWEEVHVLGVQVFHGERVEIVEKGRWDQSMRSGPGVLPEELRRIRGGR
jgi:hypothetical protein